LVFLVSWSKCLLLGILLGLFILHAIGFACEVDIQSLHFLLFISKIQKTLLILHYRIFSFGYLVLILMHVERLHFIEIVEIALKFGFEKLTIF
jgi:hypothetical protein